MCNFLKDLLISQTVNLSTKRKELHGTRKLRYFCNQGVEPKKVIRTLGHGQLTLVSGDSYVGAGQRSVLQLEGLEERWRCSEVSSCHPYQPTVCHLERLWCVGCGQKYGRQRDKFLCKHNRLGESRCEPVCVDSTGWALPCQQNWRTVRAEHLEGQNHQSGPKGLQQRSSLVLGKERAALACVRTLWLTNRTDLEPWRFGFAG